MDKGFEFASDIIGWLLEVVAWLIGFFAPFIFIALVGLVIAVVFAGISTALDKENK